MNAAVSGVGAGSASRPTVTVLDYGAGNVRSVVRALEEVGADVVLSSREADVLEADGLVVPGVGAFDAVMRGLRSVQAPRMIGRRIAGGRPVLGICVGLQILFEEGIEHGIRSEGLGEWPGTVRKLPGEVVPHMGWNTVEPPEDTVLFRGIENERFYFVHSYAVQDWTFVQGNDRMRPPGVAWSEHGARFVAAVENGPLSATQFHPEKSSAAGLRLLQNWTDSLPRTGRMASRGADKQAQTMPDPQKDVR